jgi:hypothetical protein
MGPQLQECVLDGEISGSALLKLNFALFINSKNYTFPVRGLDVYLDTSWVAVNLVDKPLTGSSRQSLHISWKVPM